MYFRERRKCRKSFGYFADNYVLILSDTGDGGEWIRFRLWPEQRRVARALQDNRLVVILKARQLGQTWLVLAFALWLMLFYPIATVLLFSRRDDEAVDNLSVRLRGMFDRLPAWLQAEGQTEIDNDHEWQLSNGSRAMAFPTTAGDSYTASLAIVDEADLCQNLSRLMRSVKPTIDGGGKMILLSRVDKTKPESLFKKMYREAKEGNTSWVPVFLPWYARPDRDAAWYEEQTADSMRNTGGLDILHEQYPATDAEAMAPATQDKRIAPAWLQQCLEERKPRTVTDARSGRQPPAITGFVWYVEPRQNRKYVIGGDPAEGNPTSDESAATVLEVASGEEVASLAGLFQPEVFAAHLDAIGRWYNNAGLMVERNNHGHAVLLWLRDNSRLARLAGHDQNVGWLSSTKGKSLLYDYCAEAFREKETKLHSWGTYLQLTSIEGATLRAPEGQHDDRATGYALAIAAVNKASRQPASFAPYRAGGYPGY